MTLRIAENLLALLLAGCFVAIACCILGRRPSSFRETNECFLAGLSVYSLLVFPLTLLTPHHALLCCVLSLGAACFLALRMPPHRSWKSLRFSRPNWIRPSYPGLIGWVGLVVLTLSVGQFVVHNLRLSYLWDGYQIWASKAQLLYYKGGLSKDWFMPGEYERILEYPPLVPVWQSSIAFIRGEFEWNSLKVIFPYFFVSSLISVYYLTRTFASGVVAIWTAAVVGLIPGFATRFSIGGYADMPQACYVIGAASAFAHSSNLMPRYRKLAPWILTGVCMVKAEGSILMLIFVAVAFVFYGFGLSALRTQRDFIVVVMGAFLLRVSYIKWLGGLDPTYGPFDSVHLVRAWHLAGAVPAACAKYMFDRSEWGLLWPAFLLSAIFLLLVGPRLHKALALGGLITVTAYTSIFYFTNWEYKWHIHLAYNRLLTQIAPVAMVTCVMALVGFHTLLRRLRLPTGAEIGETSEHSVVGDGAHTPGGRPRKVSS
jgi:hypothetical protein